MFSAVAAACIAVFIISACGAGGASSSAASAGSPAAPAVVSGSLPNGGAGSGAPVAPGSGSAPAPGSGSPLAPGAGSGSPSAPASQYLEALNPVANSGDLNTGNVEVNGQNYANSVYLYLNPGPASVSFNLGRQWRTLDTTVGVSDDSPENQKVQFQVFADQRLIYNHIFELGQSRRITLNVTNVLRLELVATLSSAYVGQTNAVWGNANLTS
jgi:NPCBM/NEW2 domain